MATVTQLRGTQGSWVFTAPVYGLTLTRGVDFEYRVDKITFITAAALVRRRKRLGLPRRMSELKKRPLPLTFPQFFEPHQTLAVMRHTGKPRDLEREFVRLVREELAILGSSQLGWSRRGSDANPRIEEETPNRVTLYCAESKKDLGYFAGHSVGKFQTLELSERWAIFQRKHGFFEKLRKVLRGNIRVTTAWRVALRNAAILAGQSRAEHNIAQAFLWNMIALETLLTARDDHQASTLASRVIALIGWAVDGEIAKTRIQELYSRRCGLVHEGDQSSIAVEDLLDSDHLLLNVMQNILIHIRLFRSQADLIDFSRRVEAEELLGVKEKTRPKTLQYAPNNPSEAEYELW